MYHRNRYAQSSILAAHLPSSLKTVGLLRPSLHSIPAAKRSLSQRPQAECLPVRESMSGIVVRVLSDMRFRICSSRWERIMLSTDMRRLVRLDTRGRLGLTQGGVWPTHLSRTLRASPFFESTSNYDRLDLHEYATDDDLCRRIRELGRRLRVQRQRGRLSERHQILPLEPQTVESGHALHKRPTELAEHLGRTWPVHSFTTTTAHGKLGRRLPRHRVSRALNTQEFDSAPAERRHARN